MLSSAIVYSEALPVDCHSSSVYRLLELTPPFLSHSVQIYCLAHKDSYVPVPNLAL